MEGEKLPALNEKLFIFVLVVLGLTSCSKSNNSAPEQANKKLLETYYNAFQLYSVKCFIPDGASGVDIAEVLVRNKYKCDNFSSPFVNKSSDVYGNNILYSYDGNILTLVSKGADGKINSSDDQILKRKMPLVSLEVEIQEGTPQKSELSDE